MQLDPAAVAAGFRVLTHATLASTNGEALALARRGEPGPLWITARHQTAGRGRQGRQWVSRPGNLYATLLFPGPASLQRAPQLSFVAALAVHDAILDRAPGLRAQLGLKWPNDVLCGGSKLAGILIESERVGARFMIAIGIGVNCMHHPAATSYPATDLAAAGAETAAADLFVALSGAMLRRLQQWRGGEGFSITRSDWLECASGLGRDMLVRLPGRDLAGRGETLDAHGRLVLRLADGTLQTITAGEVLPVGPDQRLAGHLEKFACPDGAG